MKRISAFWRVVLVMVAIGGVLTLGGLALGAEAGGLYINRDGVHLYSSERIVVNYNNTESFSEIIIQGTSGHIEVVEGATFGFSLDVNEMSNADYSLQNGVLEIDIRRDGTSTFMFGLFSGVATARDRVVVTVPFGTPLEYVNIRNTSGRVDIGGISAEQFIVNMTSGNLSINNASASVMNLRAVSGNAHLSSVSAGSLHVTMTSGRLSGENLRTSHMTALLTSGRVNLSGDIRGNTSITTTSGSVDLRLAGSEAEFNRSFHATSGRVRIDGRNVGAHTAHSGQASNSLTVRVTSGNIDVRFGQ